MPKTIAIIPARYASSRLKGKVLLAETGKTLLQHTYEQVMRAENLAGVIIAVDDVRVAEAAAKLKPSAVVFTDTRHASGTDRIYEVVRLLGLDADAVVNVQADEPEIHPEDISATVELLYVAKTPASTVVYGFPDLENPNKPEKVKAMVRGDKAQFFSRCPIPYNAKRYWLHGGLYVYTTTFLKHHWPHLKSSEWEQAENLEQLRILENGYDIAVHRSPHQSWGGVDTRQDYENFVVRYVERRKQTVEEITDVF